MKIPTINSNGDSQKNLLEEGQLALSALAQARDALTNITVNGRNFYPQGDGVAQQAVEEFLNLLTRFDAIKKEVHDYPLAVSDGGHSHV